MEMRQWLQRIKNK